MQPAYGRGEGSDGAKRVTCYVCGCPRSAQYPLAIRHQASGPYFPFLETHEPPDTAEPPTADGRILSCTLCYSYLTKQWELYERDKVPPVKRIYWLKRVDSGPYTGVEVGVQSEYASQLLGLAPDPPPPTEIKRPGQSSSSSSSGVRPPPPPLANVPPVVSNANVESKRSRIMPPQPQPPSLPLPPPGVPPLPVGLAVPQVVPQQEALDLSLDGRRGTKREREEDVPPREHSVGASSSMRTEVLDLRMPDKNATTEVCYVCGDHHKKGTLVDIYAKHSGNCPFFPSLMLHPRPSKSHPMEASGRILGCRECYSHLLLQWEAYEAHKIPHGERNYSLHKRKLKSTAFVCYNCAHECPSSSLSLIYCRPNSEKEPYYPFIQKLETPEGASPISPQGMVQVCSPCYKTITQQKVSISQERTGRSAKNSSPEVRPCGADLTSPASTTGQPLSSPPAPAITTSNCHNAGGDDADPLTEGTSCYLCHQVHQRQSMHWLSMVDDNSAVEKMHFPFLKFITRGSQNTVVEDGRVLACQHCYQHLSNQWTEYEKDNVPVEHRQFSLRSMPITSQSPRLTPGPTHSSPAMSPRTDSSPPLSFASAVEAHLKSSENISNKSQSISGYSGQPLHTLEVVPAEHDPDAPTLPIITTQHALNIAINCFVCSFPSKPGQTYALRSKAHGSDPFFPFLEKHQSAHPEARVDDSCVMSCLYCFHSLILQWQRYEKAQVDHFARLYDTYNYTCYICNCKTYRKRLYLLPVKDYPFLKEHNRPVGGMVVNNGHSVVVCKDCYSSLKNQYLELERWGVPVEKRQYNWITRPPPPEFQQELPSTGSKPIKGFTAGTRPVLAGSVASSPDPHPGTPPEVLSQPRGGGSPGGSHGPIVGSSNAVSESCGLYASSSKMGVKTTLPKSSGAVSLPVTSAELPSSGSTPSCYAPLQLKVGVARQGGSKPYFFTKRHTVASSEGVNSGDTHPSSTQQIYVSQVDRLSKNFSAPVFSKPALPGQPIAVCKTSQPQCLESGSQAAVKKGQSVMAGFCNTSDASKSIPIPSNSNGLPKLIPCSQSLVSRSHELKAKCA